MILGVSGHNIPNWGEVQSLVRKLSNQDGMTIVAVDYSAANQGFTIITIETKRDDPDVHAFVRIVDGWLRNIYAFVPATAKLPDRDDNPWACVSVGDPGRSFAYVERDRTWYPRRSDDPAPASDDA